MESDRRSVWNQSEGKIHAARDAIRLRQLHTRSREITYQSFGLDRKKQVFRLAFFWIHRTKLQLVEKSKMIVIYTPIYAPFLFNSFCNSLTSISRTVQFCFTANTTAEPAASPMQQTTGIIR